MSTIKDGSFLYLKNRESSANILAAGISDYLTKVERKNILVLGIPRGGVIIADIIAQKLNTDNFDIILPRKLSSPSNQEVALGAVMEDESTYFCNPIIDSESYLSFYIDEEKTKQLEEIKRRSLVYRNSAEPIKFSNKINDENLTVILVDDGAATGSTVIAVARWIKDRIEHKFKKLVIALPIAPKETVDLIEKECDHLEVIIKPSNFQNVNQFYKNFQQVSDLQVKGILDKWK